jgi:hypothetical protein
MAARTKGNAFTTQQGALERTRSASKAIPIPSINHALSVALHYMPYSFCRVHKTLRVTPAMAAGVTDRLWEIRDIVGVLEAFENQTAASS